MQYRELAPIGRQASVIAMGSTHFGTFVDEAEAYDILDAYQALGGNFIDTARVYGDFDRGIVGIAEGVIGRWMRLRGNRDQLILGTKGGHPPKGDMSRHRLDRESLLDDFERSLEALQTDHVDLYWLHRDQVDRPVGDILETLHPLVQSGRALSIGASNWSAARIREANEYALSHGLTPFTADEPQWALAKLMTVEDDTLVHMDQQLYRLHAETGMSCMPYSSQAKGFFIKLFEGGQDSLKPGVRSRYLAEGNLRIYEALADIHARTGASVGALALAFLTGQPFPVFPIVGVSSVSQVEALREGGDAKLNEDDMRALMALTELQ